MQANGMALRLAIVNPGLECPLERSWADYQGVDVRRGWTASCQQQPGGDR